MVIQREHGSARYQLIEGDRNIGFIDGTLIVFHGFTGPSDASRAAWEAYRALELKRTGRKPFSYGQEIGLSLELGKEQYVTLAGTGMIARLIPPVDPAPPFDEWGFEMDLAVNAEAETPSALNEIFVTATARVMWRGIRGSGLYRRMRQFDVPSAGRVLLRAGQ